MIRCCRLVRHAGWTLLLISLGFPFASPIRAEVTAEQRRALAEIAASMKRAGNLFLREKFEDSGESIREAQESVTQLAEGADAELLRELRPLVTRLRRAHALLELEGVRLPPLKDLVERTEEKPAATPAADAVRFTAHVAPMLMAKCGNCHVQRASGMFSMATFSSLMKGSSAGVVIFPRDASGSRLVEVIESGDMPRGGGKVTAEELGVLKRWIDQGARFDGPDPDAALASLVPSGESAAAPKLEVVKPTGKETVSFAADIAPILNEHCSNCHGNARQPRGRFNLTTFESMLRGGDSGPPLVPGKPQNSLLVQMLRGTAGSQRMPAGRPPLPEPVIAKIETWIQEGASFDGPDARQHIAEVSALARATRASHEQLSEDRRELALENWKLGMPGIAPSQAATKNFLVLGDGGERTLAGYGELAESLVPKIGQLMKLPADQPLIKGRMTLFVFRQRYDYSEFGQMVEKRELPREWRGHWRYSVVDAYAAVIAPRGDEHSLDSLLAQQIAATYVASLGGVPPWFAEGAGRSAAAALFADDPRVRQWDESLSGVLGNMSKADDFLTGKLPPSHASIAAYSFVKFLQSDRKRYDGLLRALRDGQPFDQAFPQAYGGTPAQVAERWAASAVRKRR